MHDPRDEIWNSTFDTYYESFYGEVVANRLARRWQLIDQITKVLVAITASGSAVAGWTLWSEEGFKILWVTIAGVAALLAIIHSAMSVADRLNDAGDVNRSFATLRIELETFRSRMRIDPEFPIEDFTQELVEFRRRYGECVQRIKDDILRTKRLRQKAQDDVDERLKGEILTK